MARKTVLSCVFDIDGSQVRERIRSSGHSDSSSYRNGVLWDGWLGVMELWRRPIEGHGELCA
jgi:hypothetical protein